MRVQSQKMDNTQPTYYTEKNGQVVPVFVIPAPEEPCRLTLIEKYRDQINKNKPEINPNEFFNWNGDAIYC